MVSSRPSATDLQLHVHITTAPLSVEQVHTLAAHAGNGAVVLMSGTVRNQTGGRPVDHLDYQAYEPMAYTIFNRIAEHIRAQWPQTNSLVIHHRVGPLAVGQISVLVAVGTPHRAEAFVACQYAIDTLKHQAPIWKKEHWQDGDSEWVNLTSADALSAGLDSP